MLKYLGLAAVCAMSAYAQSAETIPFRAVLLPSNEVPAVSINASGAATVWLHVVRNASGQITSASNDFNVTYQFPSAIQFTGLHIHSGRAGENGPVTINSTLSATPPVGSETGRGTINLQGQTPSSNAAGLATVNGMLSDPSGYYVNLHSTENPNGVIRGQLERAETVVLMGLMSPANEVPAISGSNASAFGAVIAIATCNGVAMVNCARPTSGQVIFDATYSGFPEGTSFTGFHIHDGVAGLNGPVTINTGMQSGANAVPANPAGANLHYEVEVPLDNAASLSTLAGLYRNSGAYYINLHTVVSPGGAIRAQLRTTDRFAFPVNMTTANEVPPITGFDASAPAVYTAHTIRDAAGAVVGGVSIFDVNFRMPAADTFTGLHIHNGRATENGPVTINTGLSAANPVTTEGGAGNIYRIVNVTTAPGLATLNSLVASPEAQYINLHTTARPNGVVRAQLAAASTTLPTVSAVISAVSDPSLRTVAPGGLMTVFGTNLVKTTANVGGSFNGTNLPTSFNGTQVSVGGKVAPIGVLTPTYIVAQVPLDATLGDQSVVVRNANGEAATAGSVRVANVAPALYFGTTGGLFSKLDYSLIDASNPARVGELVWVFGTGMGSLTPRAGAPRLATGDVPAIGTIYDTATATVTVGGRPAVVLASVASSGYAGLNQIVFTVPDGVSGTVPVAVTIGGVQSNSVSLMVR